MAKQLQFRRGTTAQHSSFTGAVGEVTVDTDKDTLVVHDGATAGGFPVAPQGTTYNKTEVDTLIANVDALPAQSGNDGKYLTTDGTDASWATLDTDANSTTKGLYEHSNTISTIYTIGTGNNAMSTGPMTIASGGSVTVPSGSRWIIV